MHMCEGRAKEERFIQFFKENILENKTKMTYFIKQHFFFKIENLHFPRNRALQIESISLYRKTHFKSFPHY